MKYLLPITAIAVGIIFPFGHSYTFLIQYLLMGMLFFAFLNLDINRSVVHKTHFIILITNISLSIGLFFVLKDYNGLVAEAAFITALSPTAIATPVILNLINKKVEYGAFSVLLNNIAIALLLPFLLPLLLKNGMEVSVGEILIPVLIVLGVPLIVAQSIKRFNVSLKNNLLKYGELSFYLLVLNVYIASSRATYFLENELSSGLQIVFYIALASLFILIIWFFTGMLIGRKSFPVEAGQSLGQKNNGFTIWVALTFMTPISALGPVFHVLFQNIFIAAELYYFNAKRQREDLSVQAGVKREK